MPSSSNQHIQSARGTSALAIAAVQGITDLVEEMHAAISGLAPPLTGKNAQPRKTRGMTSLVYRSVRSITGAVGWGIDRGLDVAQMPMVAKALAPAVGQLVTKLKLKSAEPYRETVKAAANGVLGDKLAASRNPLAIQMQFRQQGRALKLGVRNGKLLILIHGLCMNDLQWLRDGYDHGAMLSELYGYEPIYLHYNTGRKIADNGADFAELISRTLQSWPVPIKELVIIGHSMGGLVARSACHHALQGKHTWIKHLSKLITLGTPHMGAPLERAGRGVDYLLGISPYSAPFARLGLVRSAGIQDLRDGSITLEPEQCLWPKHTKLYTLAATQQKAVNAQHLLQPVKRLLGDGLVPVKSALAQDAHAKLGLSKSLPAARQAVVEATDHFELLSSQIVANHLLRWLKA